MAEGLAKEMLGSKYTIKSAGSMPSGSVHPNAVLAMSEIGIDITDQHSKSIKELDDDFMNNLDFVITLCAEEICPILNNDAKIIHWMNEDPDNDNFSEVQLKIAFTKVRDNLYNLIKKFFIINI